MWQRGAMGSEKIRRGSNKTKNLSLARCFVISRYAASVDYYSDKMNPGEMRF